MMKYRFLVFFLLIGLFTMPAGAQEPSPRLSQFEKAKETAFSGDFEEAIELLWELRQADPHNLDYTIYLARVYSWNQQYQESISLLQPLFQGEEEVSMESLKLMVTVQQWAGNYQEVLQFSEIALERFPNDRFYLMQKALAFNALKRDPEALGVLGDLMEGTPEDLEARALQTEILKRKKHHFSFSYLNTSFSGPGADPRHMGYLELKTETAGIPLLARLNYGSVFGLQGSQLEMDAYPKLGRNTYLYLNLGAALDTPIFPVYRGGMEIFFSLNRGMSASVGSKVLGFEEDQVLLFTGEFSLTTPGSLKMSYRPFLSKTNGEWFVSHAVALRFSNPISERFLQMDLQVGSMPYGFFTSEEFTDLTSWRLGLQYQFRLWQNLLVQPVFMYEREEFTPSQYRHRFNSQLITTLRF